MIDRGDDLVDGHRAVQVAVAATLRDRTSREQPEHCSQRRTQILRVENQAYDAVLLDVDNGPQGLTQEGNDWLYAPAGLDAAFAALHPKGVLAVWSAVPNRVFAQRLRRVGFDVDEACVRARGPHGGERRTIWIAARGSRPRSIYV